MAGSHLGDIVSLGFMAVALGMDAFSVSLGLGMQRLRLKRIAIIGSVFGSLHIIFPFMGIIVGKFLSVKIGHITTLVGGLLLVAIGSQMIFMSFNHELKKIVRPFGMGLLILSISVSIDSFPVGLSLGLSGVKTAIALFLFGTICTGMTWIGLLLGRRVRGLFGVYSEILGGSILFAFGLKIIFG